MTITFKAMNLIMKWLRCEGWATAYGLASQSTGCGVKRKPYTCLTVIILYAAKLIYMCFLILLTNLSRVFFNP